MTKTQINIIKIITPIIQPKTIAVVSLEELYITQSPLLFTDKPSGQAVHLVSGSILCSH